MEPEPIPHYRLLSPLGAGGMGEVFLAEDTRLHRQVAIKRVRSDTLDAQASRRLLTEAQAAAQLDHPNICGIHEVGEDDRGPFIVMPLVEGETLAARLTRGSLSIEESVSVAAQVADALAAAHARGILHRDIKPANIMINARGHVRVMDFGLAKFTVADAASSASEHTASALTLAGSTIGTAAYMSPEQARAEPVDPRSDLFSLGVVIHEMVTGRRPFDGPSVADTVSAMLTEDPLSLTQLRPSTPHELQRIASKLLQKKREERYQSAADVLVDLRSVLRQVQGSTAAQPPAMQPAPDSRRPVRRGWVTAVVGALLLVSGIGAAVLWLSSGGGDDAGTSASAAAPRIQSLAVLPLANLSGDASQDYFADAMTEELTRELAGIKSLRVISRTSTAQYKGAKRNLPDIARELNVDGIIEGSVVRSGDKVRITAQLIHGSTDRHLWANAYDGDLRDMLALQRRVAEAIVREVRTTLTPEEQQSLRAGRAIDPRSMELYLKGRQLFNQSTAVGFSLPFLEQALASFTEAATIQQWAEPYAGVALVRHWMATGGVNPAVLFPAARAAAQEAIRLDDRLADGHGSLAYVSFAYDWDLATAEREYRRAIDLNSATHHYVGYAQLLLALRRFDEAFGMLDMAQARDPLTPVVQMEAARARLLAKKYDEAIERTRRLPAGTPESSRYLLLGSARLGQGQFADAIAEFERAGPRFKPRAAIAMALARAGRTDEARTRLRELERTEQTADDAFDLAGVYVSLREHTLAMAGLERAFARKRTWLPQVNVEAAFDDLRGDARFNDLLRRVGIPTAR